MGSTYEGHRHPPMQCIAFTAPLRVAEAEAHRRALLSCWVGERREAYRDACRRVGITREGVWIQAAPPGPVAVVYVEADDVEAAMTLRATSSEPFDLWFREHVHRVHGLVFDTGARRSEAVLDFDVEGLPEITDPVVAGERSRVADPPPDPFDRPEHDRPDNRGAEP